MKKIFRFLQIFQFLRFPMKNGYLEEEKLKIQLYFTLIAVGLGFFAGAYFIYEKIYYALIVTAAGVTCAYTLFLAHTYWRILQKIPNQEGLLQQKPKRGGKESEHRFKQQLAIIFTAFSRIIVEEKKGSWRKAPTATQEGSYAKLLATICEEKEFFFSIPADLEELSWSAIPDEYKAGIRPTKQEIEKKIYRSSSWRGIPKERLSSLKLWALGFF